MSIPVVQTMDFNLLELLNTVSQNLVSAPSHKPGRFYFDTALGKFGISNGSAWTYVSTQTPLDAEAVQDLVAAMLSGSTGVTATYDDTAGTIQLSVATGSVTNAMVNAAAAITLDKLAETAALKLLTSTERTKLTGVATGATANQTDAYLLSRGNGTGTQTADTITDGTANKVLTAAASTKLTGIAAGATVNQTDAYLLARGNQTGTQTSTTISDFNTAVNALIQGVVGAAPAALDTLKELADALGNDANFAASMTANLALKANLSSLAPVATAGTYASLTGKPVFTQTIGDAVATTFTVTHGLGTRAVTVDVSQSAAPYTQVMAQVDKTTTAAVTVSFAVAPSAGQYTITVQA